MGKDCVQEGEEKEQRLGVRKKLERVWNIACWQENGIQEGYRRQ